ncbi:MAG: hypothetical protein QN141_03655 [Armatimonadota bacterium]|nr:hypothetical protein [Armatimonadota bacterium]MDR7451440.1 hypothetical protein [Armatimonadota bacterium]MDR7466410.1 hypothetical protein [Armatimonadota bacterium]MDR7493132.1 hypothetical protein [Armatimonadota bacterium]MDR7498111.1 hypothetical protein [Armatimonadota bacterium]
MRAAFVAMAIGAVVFGGVYLFLLRPSAAPEQGAAVGAAAERGRVQRDRGEGGVAIEVTYDDPEAAGDEADRYTVFLVALTTHSGDLSTYDMVKISELRVGGRTFRPLRWVSTSDDSHHRSGILIFPKVPSGQPVELAIKGIAGVAARTFRWSP